MPRARIGTGGNTTCRCCLESGGPDAPMEGIFHKTEEEFSVTYADMIHDITSQKVLRSDKLPHQICCQCTMELKQAYKFQQKCIKSYDTLLSLNKPNTVPVILLEKTSASRKEEDEEWLDDEKASLWSLIHDEIEIKDDCKLGSEIKVEFDVHEEDGFLHLEPVDSFDDHVTGEQEYNVAQPVTIKPEAVEEVAQDANDEQEIISNENDPSSSYVHSCSVCSEKFRFKINLNEHMKKHPKKKRPEYFCEICEKVYKNGSRHIRLKHASEIPVHKCSLCDETFRGTHSLSAHMESHKVNGMLKCSHCSLEFARTTNYYKHLMIHKEKKHLCHICSKAFTFKYNLVVHERLHTKEKPYICPLCPKAFFTGHLRNIHLDTHKNVENMDEKTLSKYLEVKLGRADKVRKTKTNMVCNECGRRFRRRVDLKDHLDKHMGIKSYFCDICQIYVQSMSKHKYTHQIKEENRTCHICNKIFAHKSSLKVHIKIHSKEKPFACDKCESRFKQPCALARHKLLHTGEKNFICHVCSKSYNTKYNLSVHIRSHTKEKPFPCDKCSKKFPTGNALTIHRLRHADYATIQCELCDKMFKTVNDRRAHMKTHKKIRKHPCRLCDKVFYRTDHRSRHERTVHQMKTETEIEAT